MNKDLPKRFFEDIAKQYATRYINKEDIRKEVVKFAQFIDKALHEEGEVKVQKLYEDKKEQES